MRLRKRLTGLFVLFLTLALVAGCAGGGVKPTEPTPAPTGGGQTAPDPKPAEPSMLTVLMGLGEEEWQVMREHVFPPFEAAHNVKIEAYQAEAQDVMAKLEAMKNANKMEIDLITQDNMELAPLVDRGLVEDLSAYRSMIPTEVIDGMLAPGEFDGKLMFLPYRPNVEISYYNETAFQAAGLTPPANWDELLEVAKTFHANEGIGKVGLKLTLDQNTTVQLFEFIRQAGGDPVKLDDEGTEKAFTFLKELYPYLGPDSRTADWNTTNRYVATDTFYLANNWPFGVNVIVQEGGKEEIKAYGGWAGPAGASKVLGGEVIGIPTGSPNKELALKFAEHLMSKEVQEVLTAKLAWPSVRSDAYGTVEAWQKPYFDAINEALKVAEPRPNLVYWATVDKSLNEAFREIVIDGKDVKETLAKYAQINAEAAK